MWTLDEYNKQFMADLDKYNATNKIGISCPNCGNELRDKHKDLLLLSSPPQKVVECLECNYIGYRYVK